MKEWEEQGRRTERERQCMMCIYGYESVVTYSRRLRFYHLFLLISSVIVLASVLRFGLCFVDCEFACVQVCMCVKTGKVNSIAMFSSG